MQADPSTQPPYSACAIENGSAGIVCPATPTGISPLPSAVQPACSAPFSQASPKASDGHDDSVRCPTDGQFSCRDGGTVDDKRTDNSNDSAQPSDSEEGAPVGGEAEQQSSATADTQASSSLEVLRTQMAHWLHIPTEDQEGIDFTFAVYASNRIPGDPLWAIVVDASGGGKTELLRTLRGMPDAEFVSKLTEKSLKSGYRDPKHPKKDPSLLPKLNDKILIIKDLSPILSMRRESRNAIIGDLRDAYDGFTDDGFGNVGKVSYESRFSLLAASTLAIERFASVDQELGERFVKFRTRGRDNRSKVRRAVVNVGKDDSWRKQIEAAVRQFLNALPSDIPQEVPTAFREPLAVVSDFVATARSHVPRDRSHGLAYVPRPEVGTRLGKEFAKVLLALAYVRGKEQPDEQDFLTVLRVAEDCLPPNRLEVLAAGISNRKATLPDKTARDAIEDLRVLGILNEQGELELSWKESLQEVCKLFSTPPLQKCATSGVSEVFMVFVRNNLSTPSDTAHQSDPIPSPDDQSDQTVTGNPVQQIPAPSDSLAVLPADSDNRAVQDGPPSPQASADADVKLQ